MIEASSGLQRFILTSSPVLQICPGELPSKDIDCPARSTSKLLKGTPVASAGKPFSCASSVPQSSWMDMVMAKLKQECNTAPPLQDSLAGASKQEVEKLVPPARNISLLQGLESSSSDPSPGKESSGQACSPDKSMVAADVEPQKHKSLEDYEEEALAGLKNQKHTRSRS